jgi:hypothetical protein
LIEVLNISRNIPNPIISPIEMDNKYNINANRILLKDVFIVNLVITIVNKSIDIILGKKVIST